MDPVVESAGSIIEETLSMSDEAVLEGIDAPEAPPAEPTVTETVELDPAVQSDSVADFSGDTPAPEPVVAGDAPPPTARDFRWVDASGNEVENPSMAEAMAGDFKLSFKADGEEQTVTINKAIAWAQQARVAQKRENTLRSERNEANERAKELEPYKEAAEASDRILTQILKGDNQLLQRMRNEYSKTLDQPTPQAPQAAPQGATQHVEALGGDFDLSDPQMAAGAVLVNDMVKPHAEALAQAYGADTVEIAQEIVKMLGSEPNMDWDLVDDIMNRRIHQALEDAGYEGQSVSFESTKWREASQQTGEPQATATQSYGLRRKGEPMQTNTANERRLAAENEALRARLAEANVTGAPDTSGGPSTGSPQQRKSGSRDADFKSDLIDVSNADSIDEVMKALDDMENKARR